MSVRLGALAVAAIILPIGAWAQAPRLNLEHQRFELENGLTLIVQEDHTTPVVAVSVWYHVGSKNEPEGRTGFAHLFEHLMFNGSENFHGEWFSPMQEIGATGVNGSTWFDRTNYYQTVPTPALDRVLWLESDRMGHLLGAIDQAGLDEQRGVVQNEKRQGESAPYGRLNDTLYEGLFPLGHPYHHSTIGSMTDLDAASLDDVREWFRGYYGPNNAVIVIAGDIAPADARARVERYFGDIPAGPEVDAWRDWIPLRQRDTHAVQYDDVPSVLANRAWVVPGTAERDRALLDIAAAVLGGGRNSRFTRELVYEREVAQSVAIAVSNFEIASVFDLSVTLKPGQPVEVADEAIDRLMARFLEEGPTREEMERAVTSINAGYIRSFETPASRAQVLAEGELYAGDPNFEQRYLEWINGATAREVRDAARRYLSQGSHQVDVLPAGVYSQVASAVDRAAGMPAAPDQSPQLIFPEYETATLSNGIRLVVAERRTVPAVQFSMVFNAGSIFDQQGREGVAALAMNMLDEGTRSRNAFEIAAGAERLGATLNTGTGLEISGVSLSALRANLEPSLVLWADVILNANFPNEAVERLRSQRLASLIQQRADPGAIALRIMSAAIFGDGHPYAVASGVTEDTTRATTREDLVRYRDTWIRPDNATILVVGDTSMAEIRPLLERTFRNWRAPSSPLPTQAVPVVARRTAPRIILVDRPGSPQSLIFGGTVAPAPDPDRGIAIDAMNDVLGGGFMSRINLNLREDKHWAYGAGSAIRGGRVQQQFTVQAAVQANRTAESLRELIRELNDVNGNRPIRAEEMHPAVVNAVRQLPADLQTQIAVLGSLQNAAIRGWPLDYAATLPRRYEALSLTDLQSAARDVVHPESMTWVIVGDRAQVETALRALNIAPIEIFDADGRPEH